MEQNCWEIVKPGQMETEVLVVSFWNNIYLVQSLFLKLSCSFLNGYQLCYTIQFTYVLCFQETRAVDIADYGLILLILIQKKSFLPLVTYLECFGMVVILTHIISRCFNLALIYVPLVKLHDWIRITFLFFFFYVRQK